MIDEEIDKEVANYTLENRKALVRYFHSKTSSAEDAEDLYSELQIALLIKNREKPIEDIEHFTNKVKHNLGVNFYRKKKQNKVDQNSELIEESPAAVEKNERPPFADTLIRLFPEFPEKEKQNLSWLLRTVLLTKYRSLQNVVLIAQTESAKQFIQYIQEKFTLVVQRFSKKGWRYQLFDHEHDNENEQYEEYIDFLGCIIGVAKVLKINDRIGIEALSIMVLAENPWEHWARISWKGAVSNEKRRKKNYKLYKPSRAITGPRRTFFRDYMTFIMTRDQHQKRYSKVAKFFDELIEYEIDKDFERISPSQPYIVGGKPIKEYVRNMYGINSLNPKTLKDQIIGGKKRTGLQEEIERFEKLLAQHLQTIGDF